MAGVRAVPASGPGGTTIGGLLGVVDGLIVGTRDFTDRVRSMIRSELGVKACCKDRKTVERAKGYLEGV